MSPISIEYRFAVSSDMIIKSETSNPDIDNSKNTSGNLEKSILEKIKK